MVVCVPRFPFKKMFTQAVRSCENPPSQLVQVIFGEEEEEEGEEEEVEGEEE